MSVNSQTTKVNLVVNIPYSQTKEQVESALGSFLGKYGANWFYVFHDKDTKSDTGESKTPHFHVLFQSSDGKKHRLLWYMTRLAECMSIDNLNVISAEIWKNYESDVQYLIHKNNPERYQYELGEVKCYDSEEFKKVLSLAISPTLTIDRIVSTCLECERLHEVYIALGLGVSQMYRGLISDIWRSLKGIRR